MVDILRLPSQVWYFTLGGGYCLQVVWTDLEVVDIALHQSAVTGSLFHYLSAFSGFGRCGRRY